MEDLSDSLAFVESSLSWIVFFLLLYLLVQLLIGYVISLKIESDQDYYLAGRHLGLKVAALSIFATWFGAETCMGSAGSIFENGLSGGRADPFGYAICLGLMAFLLASQLRKLNLVTLGDLFRLRLSKGLEKMVVLILILTCDRAMPNDKSKENRNSTSTSGRCSRNTSHCGKTRWD